MTSRFLGFPVICQSLSSSIKTPTPLEKHEFNYLCPGPSWKIMDNATNMPALSAKSRANDLACCCAMRCSRFLRRSWRPLSTDCINIMANNQKQSSLRRFGFQGTVTPYRLPVFGPANLPVYGPQPKPHRPKKQKPAGSADRPTKLAQPDHDEGETYSSVSEVTTSREEQTGTDCPGFLGPHLLMQSEAMCMRSGQFRPTSSSRMRSNMLHGNAKCQVTIFACDWHVDHTKCHIATCLDTCM